MGSCTNDKPAEKNRFWMYWNNRHCIAITSNNHKFPPWLPAFEISSLLCPRNTFLQQLFHPHIFQYNSEKALIVVIIFKLNFNLCNSYSYTNWLNLPQMSCVAKLKFITPHTIDKIIICTISWTALQSHCIIAYYRIFFSKFFCIYSWLIFAYASYRFHIIICVWHIAGKICKNHRQNHVWLWNWEWIE